ncbi:MAG: hypothetical protein IJK27_03255 [Bacilli bacterium]|nr:hypothetical protein [Bacilli bacterium]
MKSDKKKRLYISIGVGIFLIIDIILFLIFLPKFLNKNKKISSSSYEETSYVIDERSKDRYDHLFTYINNKLDNLSFSNITSIVTINYLDHDLYITGINNEKVYYIDVHVNEVSNDSLLELFKDNVPSISSYDITASQENLSNDKDINIPSAYLSATKKVALSKNFVGEYKISFTSFKDEKMYSLYKASYDEQGQYNIKEISKDTSKLLFDINLYLLNLN